MKILFIGDIVGKTGQTMAIKTLRSLKQKHAIDMVIANGENIASRNGITAKLYDELIFAGIDVVTLGNHTFDHFDIYHFIDHAPNLVRPYNYPQDTPGRGYVLLDCGTVQLAVISLMGNVFISTLSSPFEVIDKLLTKISEQGCRHIIVDFHGEATSEKIAFGRYVDGKVSAVLGTHTHVQTADEKILPNGTAYLTDVGMTGAYDSVLGVKTESSIQRFRTQRPIKFEQAEGIGQFNGVFLTLDDRTGLAQNIERIQIVDL